MVNTLKWIVYTEKPTKNWMMTGGTTTGNLQFDGRVGSNRGCQWLMSEWKLRKGNSVNHGKTIICDARVDSDVLKSRCPKCWLPLLRIHYATGQSWIRWAFASPSHHIGIVNMSIDILEKKTIRTWNNLNQLYNIPVIYIIYHGHLVDAFNPSQQEAQQLFVIVDLQKSPQLLPPPLSPRRGWASPAIVNHLVSNLTKPCLASALEVGMTRAKNALVGDPCMFVQTLLSYKCGRARTKGNVWFLWLLNSELTIALGHDLWHDGITGVCKLGTWGESPPKKKQRRVWL